MREHINAVPRSARVAALLMLAVPAVLWLFLVWDTRPYSREEIAADRARVEALPAYDRAVEDCYFPNFSLAEACERLAFEKHTAITREVEILRTSAHKWALLSMVVLVLLIGFRWPAGAGHRSFLARSGGVFAFGTITALAVGLAWWWGLELIAEQRGLEDTEGPPELARRMALLVGLTGAIGVATRVLIGGPGRAIATLSLAAVALGVAVLTLQPMEPWLPPLNVEAFLYGDQTYDVPRTEPCEPPTDDQPLIPVPFGNDGIFIVSPRLCLDPTLTRTSEGAALYLFSLAGIPVIAAALASVRRRGRGELGGPDPRRRVAP